MVYGRVGGERCAGGNSRYQSTGAGALVNDHSELSFRVIEGLTLLANVLQVRYLRYYARYNFQNSVEVMIL